MILCPDCNFEMEVITKYADIIYKCPRCKHEFDASEWDDEAGDGK